MILKFEDIVPCLACEKDDDERAERWSHNKDYKSFSDRLNESSAVSGVQIDLDVVMKSVAKTVNCISCRTAVDRLLKQLSATDQWSLALDPLRIQRLEVHFD